MDLEWTSIPSPGGSRNTPSCFVHAEKRDNLRSAGPHGSYGNADFIAERTLVTQPKNHHHGLASRGKNKKGVGMVHGLVGVVRVHCRHARG